MAQAGVGLTVGHFGGKLEERLAEHQYRAWRTYALALLMNTPRWGQPAVGAGLRWGQAFGTPLFFGLIEETGEGYFGDKADKWAKAQDAGQPPPQFPAPSGFAGVLRQYAHAVTTPSWAGIDFGVGMTLVALFGIVAFAAGIWFLADLRRLLLAKPTVSGTELFAPFAGILVGVVLSWTAYTSANKHRLLRGECRYTAARVYHNRRFKGDEESQFEYWVAGERYAFDARMDWRGGWRPLGSYWYVRYAVPDPGVCEYLDRPVPDSVRPAPAAGWAAPPEPPAPAPAPPGPRRPPCPSRARGPRPCFGRRGRPAAFRPPGGPAAALGGTALPCQPPLMSRSLQNYLI